MITTSQDVGLKVTTLQVASYGGAPCSQQLALQMKEILNVKTLIVSLLLKVCAHLITCLRLYFCAPLSVLALAEQSLH